MSIFETSDIFPSYTKTAEDFQRLSEHTVSLSLEHRERIWSGEAWGTEVALDDQWLDTPSSYSQENWCKMQVKIQEWECAVMLYCKVNGLA